MWKTFKKTYNGEKQCCCDECEQDFTWPENSDLQTALSEKSSKCEDCRKISQLSEIKAIIPMKCVMRY